MADKKKKSIPREKPLDRDPTLDEERCRERFFYEPGDVEIIPPDAKDDLDEEEIVDEDEDADEDDMDDDDDEDDDDDWDDDEDDDDWDEED